MEVALSFHIQNYSYHLDLDISLLHIMSSLVLKEKSHGFKRQRKFKISGSFLVNQIMNAMKSKYDKYLKKK